jgi:hypothetical protein
MIKNLIATSCYVATKILLQLPDGQRRNTLMQRGLSHPMAHRTIWLQLCLLQPNMVYCNTFCVLHKGENLIVKPSDGSKKESVVGDEDP